MSGVLLWPGERVEKGQGPVRCSWQLENGRFCSGLLGWPAVGSVLVERLELGEGEHLGPAEPGLYGYLCRDCRTVSIFAAPP